MGNGASGDVDYDPMYGGYKGSPQNGNGNNPHNPRARGPRNFDEINSSSTPGGSGYGGSQNDYHNNQARNQNQFSGQSNAMGKQTLQMDIAARPSQSNGRHSERAQPQSQLKSSQPKGNSVIANKGKLKQESTAVPAANKKSEQTRAPTHDGYSDDDIVFETFLHQNGETYTCMYRARQRFVMNNWNNGEWLPFPLEWFDQGVLVTDNVLRGGENPELERDIYDNIYGFQQEDQNGPQNLPAASYSVNRDDRDGEIRHPTKGIIPTYMFEEKRNIHCYFDESSGQWIKLPLAWELHSEFVKALVYQVEDQIPHWKDKQDILASLRVSNYDVNDCVTTWWEISESATMAAPRSSLDERQIKAKESKIKQLELELKQWSIKYEKATHQIAVARSDSESAFKLVSTLYEKIAELEVATQSAQLKVTSLTAQLAHYKEMKSKQQQEESGTEREERLQSGENACSITTKKKCEEENERAADLSRSSVDKKLIEQIANQSSTVNKAYHTLRIEVQQNFEECAKLLGMAVEAAACLPKASEMKPVNTVPVEEFDELKSLYRRECLQRKLLYNQLQELRGNIRVYARCRRDSRVECALNFSTDEDIQVIDARGNKKTFRFDRVYSPDSTQSEVFEETCPIVTSCVDGYNVCILAYGQTGSGKTWTMMGPRDDPGVNIRAIQELLKITDERENIDYKLTLSMMEIYNEVIQDLLTKDCKVVNVQQLGTAVNIQGLSEHTVRTQLDITELMDMGMTNRTVASTKMNSESSRSHLLVRLTIEGKDLTSKAKSKGTLTLVDLAGSERVSKTDASGQRLVEAAAINKSLTALGQVFTGLGQSALHVPFRNSKLTQVLQPSLSGDAKAALFVACSPAESNISETISTLTFGSNAKQIELGQAKKNVSKKR